MTIMIISMGIMTPWLRRCFCYDDDCYQVLIRIAIIKLKTTIVEIIISRVEQ